MIISTIKPSFSVLSVRDASLVCLFNESAGEELTMGIALANAFTLKQKDTILLPYGKSLNGKKVQVFTRACAEEMVSALANEKQKDPDYGIPIYIGHPDVPGMEANYPDKAAYAWIYNMEAGPDGLLVHPKWSDEGTTLLANAKFRFPSPYWGCRLDKKNPQTVSPIQLISIGLTNRPNIKAIGALVNEAPLTTQGETQMKELLAKLFNLANDATEEQITAAAQALANEHKTAQDKIKEVELALANEKNARVEDKTAADATLAQANAATTAERGARIELIANSAIAENKITVAQKSQTIADLQKDLDGTMTKLANAQPVVAIESKTKNLGSRKAEGLSAQDNVLALVNERMTKGEDYLVAFANVKKGHPDLFKGMKQPQSK